MRTKELVILSLFVAIGVALHAIVPPIFNGMKPDMMLLMMFLGIFLFPGMTNAGLLGIATGILSGLTTSFPGGLVPNIIDKILTAFLIYFLFLALKPLKQAIARAGILTVIGTLNFRHSVSFSSALTCRSPRRRRIYCIVPCGCIAGNSYQYNCNGDYLSHC
ncbi:hypothetical protein ACVIJU_001209 [Aeribacillus sp. SP014]